MRCYSRPIRWLHLNTVLAVFIVIAGFSLLNAFQFEHGRVISPTVSHKTSSPFSSAFFAMGTVDPSDYPAVPIGALGHPPEFAWAWIEQQQGQYTYSIFDPYVQDALSHNVPIVLTFGWTPQFYAKDPNSCHPLAHSQIIGCTSPPTSIQPWKNFITNVVTHYKGEVKYYELWNEVNGSTFWTGTVQDMVSLGAAAYPIIHSIDPSAMLLTPSVTGPVAQNAPHSASVWMTQYLQDGGNQYADAGTFHGYIAQTGVSPYPWPEQDSTSGCNSNPYACYGSIITKATVMRQVYNQNGLAGKPMFDTEGSWGDMNVTDPNNQAAWLARWYILQASNNLQSVSWYTWGLNQNGQQTWGNIENPDHTPNLAGVAYGQIYSWLVGATMTTACSSGQNSTWTCIIMRPGGYQGEIVWNTASSRSVTPQRQYKQYQDLQGNIVRIHGNVTIGLKPILLETGNIP